MKILVFSDSHGSRARMESAIRTQLQFGKIDRIFFLGDGIRDFNAIETAFPSIISSGVYGNCDNGFDPDAVFLKTAEVGGFRFLLMHGHKYNVKTTLQTAADYAIAHKADVLLFGHTHQPTDMTIDGSDGGHVRLINPGSIGDWHAPSYALLDLVDEHLVCGFGTVKG